MIGIFRLNLQPKKSRCQIFKFKIMQKKSFFIGTMTMLLVLIFVSCSNEQPTSVEKKRNLPAQQRSIIPTNDNGLITCKKDAYFTALNHNDVLSMLYERIEYEEFDFHNTMAIWLEILNENLLLSGYETLSDIETEQLNIAMELFYTEAINSFDFIGSTSTLIDNLPFEQVAKDLMVDLINSIDLDNQTMGCDFLYGLEQLEEEVMYNDELVSFRPYVWSAQYIYPASNYYWSRCVNSESDSDDEDEETEENIKELRCAIVDVIGGFAASTTGVGAVLSGVVGAVVSFMWAEGVEPILAEARAA